MRAGESYFHSQNFHVIRFSQRINQRLCCSILILFQFSMVLFCRSMSYSHCVYSPIPHVPRQSCFLSPTWPSVIIRGEKKHNLHTKFSFCHSIIVQTLQNIPCKKANEMEIPSPQHPHALAVCSMCKLNFRQSNQPNLKYELKPLNDNISTMVFSFHCSLPV